MIVFSPPLPCLCVSKYSWHGNTFPKSHLPLTLRSSAIVERNDSDSISNFFSVVLWIEWIESLDPSPVAKLFLPLFANCSFDFRHLVLSSSSQSIRYTTRSSVRSRTQDEYVFLPPLLIVREDTLVLMTKEIPVDWNVSIQYPKAKSVGESVVCPSATKARLNRNSLQSSFIPSCHSSFAYGCFRWTGGVADDSERTLFLSATTRTPHLF